MSYVPPTDFTPPPIPAVTPYSAPADLTEFEYYSQFNTDTVGIIIAPNATPIDADNKNVTLRGFLIADPGTSNPNNLNPVFISQCENIGVGTYTYTFNPSTSSSIVGYYRLDWSYLLSGIAITRSSFIEIGPPSPAYDALPMLGRQIVNDVWAKFADGMDSANGGPNIQSWYQTHFNRGRVAQLLKQAIQHIDVSAQPAQVFTSDGKGGPLFPYQNWLGLLNSALTVEVIKHLIRSYTEDPIITAPNQARMDRTSYQSRWQSVLQMEQDELKTQKDTWKIYWMFQGSPRVLVAGGAFGNFGPIRMVGNLAARPAYMWRFY